MALLGHFWNANPSRNRRQEGAPTVSASESSVWGKKSDENEYTGTACWNYIPYPIRKCVDFFARESPRVGVCTLVGPIGIA